MEHIKRYTYIVRKVQFIIGLFFIVLSFEENFYIFQQKTRKLNYSSIGKI